MRDGDSCPMCGMDLTPADAERVCGTCRMLIPENTPYFLVIGPARYATLCSDGCVRTHVLMNRRA